MSCKNRERDAFSDLDFGIQKNEIVYEVKTKRFCYDE